MSAQGNKDKEPVKVSVQNIYRLTPQQYQELEKKATSKVHFRDETNAVQAGYLVGVQDVLRLVRDGFTVG